MHTDSPGPLNAHIVAYLVADDPPAVDWLEDMGVVAIDENGAWRLTALGEVAMARFNGRYRADPGALSLTPRPLLAGPRTHGRQAVLTPLVSH